MGKKKYRLPKVTESHNIVTLFSGIRISYRELGSHGRILTLFCQAKDMARLDHLRQF